MELEEILSKTFAGKLSGSQKGELKKKIMLTNLATEAEKFGSRKFR